MSRLSVACGPRALVVVLTAGALALSGCGGGSEKEAKDASPQATGGVPAPSEALRRAWDREAMSDLRNALTAEKSYYVDHQAYTEDSAALAGIEPGLNWITSAPTAPKEVRVAVSGTEGQTVCTTAHSRSGTHFSLKDTATGSDSGTRYYRTPNCEGEGADGW
ncbi:MAG: hypothetical protein WDA71_08870 [Actinomycetota bacterium]